MCGSACLGSVVNINLLHGNYNKAKEICTLFKDIFELIYNLLPDFFRC